MAPQSVETIDPDRVVAVIGVDFTAASEYAIRLATSLVSSVGPRAELHLVHVTPPPYWFAMHGGDVPASLPIADAEATRKRLLDACFTLGRGLPAVGHPPRSIRRPDARDLQTWLARWMPTSSSSAHTSARVWRARFTARRTRGSYGARRAPSSRLCPRRKFVSNLPAMRAWPCGARAPGRFCGASVTPSRTSTATPTTAPRTLSRSARGTSACEDLPAPR